MSDSLDRHDTFTSRVRPLDALSLAPRILGHD